MSYRPNETLLLRYIGASPILRLVDFFLDNPLSDYSKNEIAKNLAMSRVTFFKYWKELEKSGALIISRKIGKATLYKLDRQNEVVKQLIKLDMALTRRSMKRAVEEYQKPVPTQSMLRSR
jgi:biotin operon repressor